MTGLGQERGRVELGDQAGCEEGQFVDQSGACGVGGVVEERRARSLDDAGEELEELGGVGDGILWGGEEDECALGVFGDGGLLVEGG